MSGIAGIYNLDGRPVDPTLLHRMTNAIAHRGPDGIHHWIDGSVGLGHCMLQTTPESLYEKQPVKDETGQLCLTLDGRVDNRDDLKASLEAKGARLRDDTDAELVLKAYEVWGEMSPEKILGDFAYVIWDGRNRLLFCARDMFGLKPLYYYFSGSTFRFGSELPVIFADPNVPREPNEGMIGEYLAWSVASQDQTLYQKVFRLPPSHALIIQSGQLSTNCYWNIDLTHQVRYRTDEEYAEHFFEIFKESVCCRLRSHGSAGAHLSGGLDSSSVVSMAQWLFREGVVTDRGFETFSLVFPGHPCDESTYINDVVAKWELRSNTTEPAKLDVTYYEEQVLRYQDFPDFPNGGALQHSLMEQVHAKRIRVLLTGAGGDQWLTGSQSHHADFLRDLKILAALKQARGDRLVAVSMGETPPSYLSLFFKSGVWPLLPTRFQRGVRRILHKGQFLTPTWLNPQFVQLIKLSERLSKPMVKTNPFASHAQAMLAYPITSGWHSMATEIGERTNARFGIEERHPYYDRRVVEFALAIPEEQRWRYDEIKFVLRQAMRNLLPESIRQRRSKADFTHLYSAALGSVAIGNEKAFEKLAIASLGWVSAEELRLMYQRMGRLYSHGDQGYWSYIWPLWMSFAVDLWYRIAILCQTSQIDYTKGLNKIVVSSMEGKANQATLL